MKNKQIQSFRRPAYATLLLATVILCWGHQLLAQTVSFPIREMSNKLYGSSLSGSSPNILTVANDQRSNMLAYPSTFPNYVKYKSNYTIVKWSIDHAATTVPLTGYVYKMAYTLQGATGMTTSGYTYTAYDTLVIAYNPDSLTAYQDMQIKVYPQLYDAKLTITGFFDITSGAPVSLPMPPTNKNFFVELSMQYQPYLKTHYLPADMALNTSQTYDATKQMLNISWAPSTTPMFLGKVTPAQYELEWTYVDNYAANGGLLSPSALSYNFKNNATRIITDSLAYALPVIYPKGYLIYRVRMIRVDDATYKYPIYGVWSLPTVSGTISSLSASKYYQITTGHSGDSLNWNYTMHFAEGGKYKHVIGYFDGMLKNRQTITRFNTNPDRLLATENIYDFEGRQAISTLPTVISSARFGYQKGVSTSSVTGLPYSAYDFDLKPVLCPDAVIIPPFATGALANRYYSRLNTDTADMQKYVPQAEGYPFVHTQRSTGFADRIEATGGAGTVLQINKGHDTKNEYLQADQPDLNNLFGINVGVSSFYTKTVTRDPNGQSSMVVKDYKGKQILSSLIGAAVDTTKVAIIFNDEVPAVGKFRENKLSNPAANITVASSKVYSGSFYMDYEALSNIKYEYAFSPFEVCPAPAFLGLSVKCTYDYDVHDNCGIEVLHKKGTLGITGVTTTAIATPFSEDTNITLKKGKYTINKTLTIADGEVVAAVDSFLNRSPNCLKSENDFIREAVERNKYPCPSSSPCDLLKQKMMEELFTDAKYGKWRKGTVMVPVVGLNKPDSNSIYDIPQFLPGGVTPKHRFRSDCVLAALNALVITKHGKTYLNIGGDSIKVVNAPGDTTYIVYDTAVSFFKDEIYTGSDQYTIAAVLLPLHPEYCKLLACFDDTLETRLKAIPNANIAIKYNLFNLDSLVAKDVQLRNKMMAPPFNKLHIADSLKLLMNGMIRMDTMAAQMAFCLNDDAAAFSDARTFFHANIVGLNFPTSRVKDSYFNKLRTFYLANRTKYVNMAKTGADNTCLPCDSTARMKLIPKALIPVLYTSDGGYSFGPDGFASLFSDSSIARIKKFLTGTSGMPADTAGAAGMKDSATRVVVRADSALCSIAVDSIMARLSNCFAAGASTSRLKDSLLALIVRGEVHNGIFFPEQVRNAIVGAGISLTDLCHPYVMSYDFYDEGVGDKGNCNASSFYDAATTFFNTPSINNHFKGLNSGYQTTTPVWPTGNFFATKIAAGITGGSGSIIFTARYNSTDSIYNCYFYKTGSSDSVAIYLRSPKNIRRAGSTFPFLFVAASDSIIFKNVTCFFDDPTAYAEGHIGRFMFRAQVERSETISGSVVKNTGQFLGWNNGKVVMNEDGSNPLSSSVPCTQFKAMFKAFADSMTLYGGFAQDHPLFSRSMRNFMNYRMKKVFSELQYNRFLASCALADSMRIPMYGGYGRISFPTVSGPHYDSFAAFRETLALSEGYSVGAILDYKTSTTETAIIDYETIPFNKLRSFNDLVQASGGTVKPSTATSIAGRLYLPATLSPSGFIAGTTFSLSPSTAVKVRYSPYLPDWIDYLQYDVSAPSANFSQLSAGGAKITKNIYDASEYGFWLPTNYSTVNKDYANPNKKAYLQYAYSMQALTNSKVLDTLQDYLIKQNVSAFSGTQVSYSNPENADRFTDLFYTNTLSRLPGYDTVAHVLSYAQAALGTGKIFMATSTNKVTLFGGTGSGKNLIMYRCADGLYWYRYFGAGSQLFNMFVRVPAYIFQNQHPNLVLLNILPATGDTLSANFQLALTLPGSNDTFYAEGTTNFNLAWTQKLNDVLLGNEKNFSKGKEAPLSGLAGAEPNCEQKLLNNDIYEGKINYYNYISKYKEDLLVAFRDHVMKQVGEKLWIEYVDMRFGTTLYSYDRANNLIQTVPPEGIKKIDSTTAKKVDSLRASDLRPAAAIPNHLKSTRYEYNTANQVWKENTPDAGTKIMYYDLKGNVLLSQNAKQRPLGRFTYFLYDGQNRLNETGEVDWSDGCAYFDRMPLYATIQGSFQKTPKPFSCACENPIDSVWEFCSPSSTNFYDDAVFNAQIRSKVRTQVVYTVYDSAFVNMADKRNMTAQENLRSRIGANMYYTSCAPGLPAANFDHATHYSYDAAGNIKTLVQDFPKLDGMQQRYKRIDYEYDLLSGKVNMISYNHGYADQFFQRYQYDADNRLTKAETSRDGFIWKRDAEYSYYQHGPLARTSIGDQRVQGMDYAYTLQGWLKSINGDSNDSLSDMGGDGKRINITPKDAYSSTLDYFEGDYKAIGYTPLSRLVTTNKSLYNGNIARQSKDIAPFAALTGAYTYDQMNRIRKVNYAATKRDTVLLFNNWFASAYKYDMDGNIKSLTRREAAGTLMDSMIYQYGNPIKDNRITNIIDYAGFSRAGVEDFNNTIGGTRIWYDNDGNIRNDNTVGLEPIEWNIYNKATSIYVGFPNGTGPSGSIYFGYDGLGHRVSKSRISHSNTTGGLIVKSTYYVREASGNILAEYNAIREEDTGAFIKVLPAIRGFYTGTTLKYSWLSALSSLGYLTDPLFAGYITAHIGATSTYATGYYLANNAGFTQQFVSGGFGVLPALCTYSANMGLYPVADALRSSFSQQGNPNNTLNTMSTSIFGNPDPLMREHALLQMAQQVPDLYTEIAQQNQITVNNANDSMVLFNAMNNIANTNPAYFGTRMATYYQQNPSIIDNWLNAVTSDSNYMQGGWYQQNGFTSLLQNTLLQYADITAQNQAIMYGAGPMDKPLYGLYGFASWWPMGSGVLNAIAGNNALAQVSYYNDPIGYLSSLTDYAYMDTALSLIPSVDLITLADVFGVTHYLGTYSWRAPTTIKQEISLGNHHLYGTSRIGIDNYWPSQYRNAWDFNSGLADTTRLGQVPWYSYAFNDVIDTNKTEPSTSSAYNGLVHSTISQHLLGQKQYELSNHLGNVQVSLSDKRYVKTKSAGLRDYFNAAIVAAYDYYPYGQLMPGRYVSDTATQCVTTTQLQIVPVKTQTALSLINAIAINGATSLGSGFGSGTTVYGKTGGLEIDIPVTAGVPISLTLSVGYIYGSFVNINVSEIGSSGTKTLNSTNINYPISLLLAVSPSTSTIKLKMNMMSSYITAPPSGLFRLDYAAYDKISYEPENVLVTLCNKGTDKYEFGFNGQMKMNEVLGVGNWNTAEFWEYNTRTARRANPDPKPHIGISDYSVMGSNPIANADPNGDYFFGLVGSTSGQRAAAKAFASSVPNGKVHNKMSKDINVSYTQFGVSKTEEGDFAATITAKNTGFSEKGFPTILGGAREYEWEQQNEMVASGRGYRDYDGFHKGNNKSGIVHMADPTADVIFAVMTLGSSTALKAESLTNSEGFLFGSVTFKAPTDIRVGLFASEKTVTNGTFQFSTIAPKSWFSSSYFGRSMLQITPKFQSTLGEFKSGLIPKGTPMKVGIVGPQSGNGIGIPWFQIFTPTPVKL